MQLCLPQYTCADIVWVVQASLKLQLAVFADPLLISFDFAGYCSLRFVQIFVTVERAALFDLCHLCSSKCTTGPGKVAV